jgi:hypothetical protein
MLEEPSFLSAMRVSPRKAVLCDLAATTAAFDLWFLPHGSNPPKIACRITATVCLIIENVAACR